MKTFIVGIFSLTLLATQAAGGAPGDQCVGPKCPTYPHGAFPAIGVPAVCNFTAGIMVVVLQKTGDVTAFVCSLVEGQPIMKKDSEEAGMTLVKDGDLGIFKKYKRGNEPDPCYQWTVDGESHFYCW